LWTAPAGVIDVWDASERGTTPLHGHHPPIATLETPELRCFTYFIFSFTFSLEFVHEYESDYAEVLYRSHEQCNATKVVK
jgi:hypothetical protein